MKPNELMAGDWAMVNDVEHTHPLQVVEIFKKCGTYYATLYWDGMPGDVQPDKIICEVDKIEPIPLTPEILEKNGFTLEHYTLEHYSGDVMTGYWWTRNDFVIHNSMNDAIGRNNFKYEYVHQLQNALRLCGIEKTIEL